MPRGGSFWLSMFGWYCGAAADAEKSEGGAGAADLLAFCSAELDDALEALARHDGRKARAVELRFFGGLTIEETAEALGTSVQTVRRDWVFAQAWLLKAMTAGNGGAE